MAVEAIGQCRGGGLLWICRAAGNGRPVMTAALPFTQAGVCRAIKAAHKAGLRVTGIRPDGTVIVSDGEPDGSMPPVALHDSGSQNATSSKWDDVEA
jgi:hypothetical protein